MQVNSPPISGAVTQTIQTDIIPNSQANSLGRAAWIQANNQSFGFFVPQDSVFGNNILPVLPRSTNPPK